MRIVSLCPSLTELVFALERGPALVGITDYCIHPADGVATIEKIGGTKSPNVDRIIALAPDLVLLNDEENRLEDARALADAGLVCLSSLPKTPADTAEMVRSIGSEVDRPEIAEQIALDIEARAARVAATARHKPPVTFAYLIWRKPWMTVSGDTFAHSLLALAGGVNVFATHRDRYPHLTSEELAAGEPDALLLGSEPFPFTDAHADELTAAIGIERSRIHLVDGEYLSWYGSRTPDGIDYAERVLQGLRAGLSG